MSIAVATVVKPSRLLLAMTVSLCIGIAVIACLIGFGLAGNFLPGWRLPIVIALSVIPLMASWCLICGRKSLHIDISDNGQITVAEDKAFAIVPRGNCLNQERDSDEVVKLLPNSTIWPHLLLLRLQAEDRTVRNVLIVRDCMSVSNFRALSVACRWIAARTDHVEC